MAKKPTKSTANTPVGAMTLEKRLESVNQWREQYNPLRGLTIHRVVSMLEESQRGLFADLQWTYSFVEMTDPDLMALIERRISAMLELDWDIKVPPDAEDAQLAEAQRLCLEEAYERLDNIEGAIEHLAMATFRGFAHLEKHRNALGQIIHLEPLDPWNVVRNGRTGKWKYNPQARLTDFKSLPEENLLEDGDWIVREVARPINRIGLYKFVETNLSLKDWAGYIEIYGVPGAVVIGPPQVPAGKEQEYQDAANSVARGVSGSLPNGSTIFTADGPRNTQPFEAHLRYWSEKLILAGTGGKLTMLAEAGSGTLAGGAHADAFKTLAKGEAKKISGVFQRGLDCEILDAAFPGQPHLAYFELAANEETDTGAFVGHVAQLATAGLAVAPEQVKEKTGYTVTPRPVAAPPGQGGQPNVGGPMLNRAGRPDPEVQDKLIENVLEDLTGASRQWLEPVVPFFADLRKAADSKDVTDEQFQAMLNRAAEKIPGLFKKLNSKALADSLEKAMGAAAVNGAVAGMARAKKN